MPKTAPSIWGHGVGVGEGIVRACQGSLMETSLLTRKNTKLTCGSLLF